MCADERNEGIGGEARGKPDSEVGRARGLFLLREELTPQRLGRDPFRFWA
jgi:hypothetical protein